MKYLSIIFDLLILILGIRFAFKRYNSHKRIDIFIVVNALLCLYYGFIPLLIKTFSYQYPLGFMITLENIDGSKYFFVSFICFILYSVFLIINKSVLKPSSFVNEGWKENKSCLSASSYKVFSRFAYLCFIIGFLSFLILAHSVGGIGQLIKIGDLARGYGKDLSDFINSSLLPLRTLLPILYVPPFLFYVMGKNKKTISNLFMFWLSFVISILFLLFNAGRTPLLLFVLPFILLIVFKKFKHPWLFVFFMAIITIPFLNWLDDLFFYLSYGSVKSPTSEMNIIQYIVEQFGYPYVNMINADSMINNFGLRFGLDYCTWIINIIPTLILSKFGLSKVPIITDYITEYYAQVTFLNKMSGGIPVDLFTLGYLQLGFIGAILFVATFSFFVKYLDKKFYNDKNYDLKQIIYIRTALVIAFLVPNIGIDSIVRGRFDIIILITLVIITIGDLKRRVR